MAAKRNELTSVSAGVLSRILRERPGHASARVSIGEAAAGPGSIAETNHLTGQHLYANNQNVLPIKHFLKGQSIGLAAGLALSPSWLRAGALGPPQPDSKTNSSVSTNVSTLLPSVTVTGNLDRAREQIAPELGAVAYTIGPNQIQTTGQGENASFQQLVLQSPGVVEDEFGEVHVRGDHGDVQYRVNGVLLPESLNGFAQEIDPHLIHSITLMTGTLPAEFGFRTAGIFDVTTKTGSQLDGNEFSLYGGSYDTFHPSLQLGGAVSNFEYFVTLSYLHDDLGIDNTTASTDPIHDHTDQEKAFGYLSYSFDPTSRLTLLLNASYAEFQIPDTPGLAPNYSFAGSAPADSSIVNENQNEQNYYTVLSYQKSAGDLSFQVSGFTRDTDIAFNPDYTQDLLLWGHRRRCQK